jgi:hypothetical protein
MQGGTLVYLLAAAQNYLHFILIGDDIGDVT